MIREGAQEGTFHVASEALGSLPEFPAGQWLAGREFAGLPASLAAFVRVCAVLGAEFTRGELREVIADAERSGAAATPLDVDVGLAMLERRGFVASAGADRHDHGASGDGATATRSDFPYRVWLFAKPLFRDTIYRQVAPTDRQRIHRSALRYWRARAAAASDSSHDLALAAVARHAQALQRREPAVVAHLELGDRARKRHHYVEADWHYTCALALLEEPRGEHAFRAQCGRGMVRYRLHRVAESIADLRRAVEVAAASDRHPAAPRTAARLQRQERARRGVFSRCHRAVPARRGPLSSLRGISQPGVALARWPGRREARPATCAR